MTIPPTTALVLTLLLLSATAASAQPSTARPDPPRPLDRLQRLWPDHPEALAMFVDILSGSQLGPADGWFRKATAQTRFTWDALRTKLDADHDGTISPAEFGASDDDFQRLDRDHDGALTPADLDFSPHALGMSPGAMLYRKTDRNGDGKVTREEFDAFFQKADSGAEGFLSLDDLRAALPAPGAPSGASARAAPPRRADDGPTRATLVRGLLRQEIGSLQAGPALGATAPDFTLSPVGGGPEVTLSGLEGDRPVVLIFGNFTCGPFRMHAGNIEKLYHRYKDRAHFALVYVREAHPTDGWQMESNDQAGVSIAQPRDFAARTAVAQTCRKTLGFDLPMLVDTMDDRVGARYSGMPSRLYLIDRQGKVAYKSGRGPFGFKPAELETSLLLLLRLEPTATQGHDKAP